MTKFAYKAQAKDGKTSAGTFEAPSREAALAALAKQGLRPIIVREAGAADLKKGGLLASFGKKVGLRDRVIFTRQLSTMVSAGVPLPKALATLGSQAESPYFKSVIASVSKDVEAGNPLSMAFGKFPDVFSEIYVNMVHAGEEGGILDEVLKRLAMQIEKDASIRKKVKGAMTYPTVVMSITVIAFFGLMVFIIPKIGKILKDLGGPNAKLPVYTQAMLDTSNFLLSPSIMRHIPLINLIPLINRIPNVLFVIAAMGIGMFYLLRYIKTPVGKLQFHTLMLKIPVIKTLIVKVAVARFARTFSSLTAAGVTVLNALEVTGGAIGNKVLENELKAAAEQVRNGKPLSEPISQSPYFPPIVAQMLAVGEETGQIDKILVKVADFYDEEVDTIIDSLSSIIEPVMIVVLGSLVGLIAASVMGPIASLSQNVNANS